MTQDELFERLTANALDFVVHAIEQFRAAPKYSIINFYAAVELFLKARLLREHWSLVVNKEPDGARFESGDFQSVSFEGLCTRLDRVVGSPVPPDAYRAFDSVRRHRNKMVHFFHQADQATIEAIAAEQLLAWWHLNHLLTVQWADVFASYTTQLSAVERQLTGHRDYLKAKFAGLQTLIQERRAAGVDFTTCPSCKFEAAEVKDVLGALRSYDCLVCGFKTLHFQWECPQCKRVSLQNDGGEFICEHCEHKADEDAIVATLNEEWHKPDEASLATTPANCSECEGGHTVIEYDGQYLCVRCFDVSEGLDQCEWCSEYNNGDMTGSYVSGCSICEGYADWHADE